MTNNKTVLAWLEEMKTLLTPDEIVWVDGSDEQRDELRRLALPIVFEGDPTLVTLSELDALQTSNDTPKKQPNAAELYMTPAEKHYAKGITSLEAVWTVTDESVEYYRGPRK